MLEQGCGSGRQLLEAQSLFPSVQFFGTNFKGYGAGEPKSNHYGQVDDDPTSLIRISKHFKLPVMCSLDGRPVLPLVKLTPSIADVDFVYPFPEQFFDLIVSRDALNSMKLKADESHVYIPKMLRVLKQGHLAAVQTDYGANMIYPNAH